MKPYGKKPEKTSSCKIHSSDKCGICNTIGWKISKKRARRKDFNTLAAS